MPGSGASMDERGRNDSLNKHQGFTPGVPVWAAFANGAAGPAPPRISSTVLLVGLATQTLPELSMAIPDGALDVLPVIVERKTPAFDTTVMTPLPFPIRTLLLPSMAKALAAFRPVGE